MEITIEFEDIKDAINIWKELNIWTKKDIEKALLKRNSDVAFTIQDFLRKVFKKVGKLEKAAEFVSLFKFNKVEDYLKTGKQKSASVYEYIEKCWPDMLLNAYNKIDVLVEQNKPIKYPPTPEEKLIRNQKSWSFSNIQLIGELEETSAHFVVKKIMLITFPVRKKIAHSFRLSSKYRLRKIKRKNEVRSWNDLG
jgi:hypothetical protein